MMIMVKVFVAVLIRSMRSKLLMRTMMILIMMMMITTIVTKLGCWLERNWKTHDSCKR